MQASERTETMQILFIKKKSQGPIDCGPLSRGQQRRARGQRLLRPGRGGVDPGSARASCRTAAPGADWRGGLGPGREEEGERRLHRKAFTGDALRPPDGRRGSGPIKVASLGRKEGAREGREQLGGGAASWAAATAGGAAQRGHVLVLLFSSGTVLAGPSRGLIAPKPGGPDLPGDRRSPW